MARRTHGRRAMARAAPIGWVLFLLLVAPASNAQTPDYNADGVRTTNLSLESDGPTVTGRYTVETSTSRSFPTLVVAVRDSNGNNYDFVRRTNVTVDSGSPRTFTGTRSLPQGSYRAWVAYRKSDGRWVNLSPTKSFSIDDNADGVRATDVSISPSGSTAEGSYTVDVSTRTTFRDLVLAVRGSDGNNYDFVHRNDVSVSADASQTFSGSRTLPQGSYRAWVAYRKPDGGWVNLAPTKTFTVADTGSGSTPGTGGSGTSPGTSEQPPDGPWTLAFEDEFSGNSLDTSKWETKYGGRAGQMQYANPGNGEAQWYKPENCVQPGDGYLHQRAKREDTVSPYTGRTFHYSSCIITSRPSLNFEHGYLEARVKVPKGAGFWPAFWTWPQNEQWPPEIDAMEFYGDNPTLFYLTYHGASGARGTRVSASDWSSDWHTVAVDWEPGQMTWYVDGARQMTVGEDPNLAMYLIANLAVCDGARCPAPNSSTPFPADYLIDHIRVWRRP